MCGTAAFCCWEWITGAIVLRILESRRLSYSRRADEFAAAASDCIVPRRVGKLFLLSPAVLKHSLCLYEPLL